MAKKPSMTRRNFIKAAGAAGGVALMAGSVTLQEGQAATQEHPKPDAMLKGVSDIHIHASPDSRPRSINELDFARQAYEAGYRSIMFKSNDFSCHDRAYLIRQALPGFACFGSLCMNAVHGDKVNVRAAEAAVNTTGNYCRCIWMPTMDAVYPLASMNRPGKGIPVLGDNGAVLPEVVRVMEICAEADIIFATGHSSPAENLVLATKAKDVGLKKFVVTHANSGMWKMTPDQIKQAADLGAWLEFCFLPNLWGPGTGLPNFPKASDAEFIGYVSIVPDRSFVTTDLGQVDMPNPLDGMRTCIVTLQKAGISAKSIDDLVRNFPAQLMGLSPA